MITFFSPPAMSANEPAREAAVIASGLLHADIGLKFQSVVERARTALGTTMAALTVIYRDRQIVIASSGTEIGVSSRSASFCGHAILQPFEVFCVPDATLDDRFAGNPAVLDEPKIRFYAGAPLRTADGNALGTLCVLDPKPRDGLRVRESAELRRLANEVMAFAQRGQRDRPRNGARPEVRPASASSGATS